MQKGGKGWQRGREERGKKYCKKVWHNLWIAPHTIYGYFFIRNCRPSRDIFTIFNAKISSLKIEICKHSLKNIFGSKILYIKKKWINTVILIPKIQHNLFHFDFSVPK